MSPGSRPTRPGAAERFAAPGRSLATVAWLGPFLALTLAGASPAAAATLGFWSVTAFDRGGGPGHDIVVPVSLAPADGVTSVSATFAYDPAVAVPTGIYRTPFTHLCSVNVDLSEPGSASFTLSGPPLAGTGEIAWIVFRATAASGGTDLSWTAASLNGGAIPAVLQNGRLPIVGASRVSSVPDDAQGPPGARVEIPVSIQPSDGASAVDLRVRFDPWIWTLVDVRTTPLTAGMTLTWNTVAAGEVAISLFQSGTLAGSGAVVVLEGDIVGAIGDRSPVNVTRSDVDEVPSLLDDGLVAACGAGDLDHDGVTGCAGDCDDSAPAVYPGAPEICNGMDDDCDGVADDGVTLAFYRDDDADGYGSPGAWVRACEAPAGFSPVAGDCDDSNAARHPGAAEMCNGVDDDCDDAVDEGVPVPGAVGGLQARRLPEGIEISWSAVLGAAGYDATRGDLDSLRATAGGWGSSALGCVADGIPGTTILDTEASLPPAVWYLVRGSNCGGGGSWSSGAPAESAGRDAGIGASGAACP